MNTTADPVLEQMRDNARRAGTFEGALANIIHMAQAPAPDAPMIAAYAREVLRLNGSDCIPPVAPGTGWPVPAMLLGGPPEYEPDDGEAQRIAETYADAADELARDEAGEA